MLGQESAGEAASFAGEAMNPIRLIVESFANSVFRGQDAVLQGVVRGLPSDGHEEHLPPWHLSAWAARESERDGAIPLDVQRVSGGWRLATADLPVGRYHFAFQIIRDSACVFEVTFALDVVAAPVPVIHDTSGTLPEIALLGEALRRLPMDGPVLLFEAAAPAESAEVADQHLPRLLEQPVEIEPGCPIPITRFMLHLRASLRLQGTWHLRTAQNRFDFLCWYARDAAGHVPGGRVPMPRRLSRFLNGDVLPSWSRPTRLSQLMFWYWQDTPLAARRLDPAAAPELYWQWAHGIMPWFRMDPSLMPAPVAGALARLAPGQAEPAILSVFAHRLHAETATLRERYSLDAAADRIALVFALLLEHGADPRRGPLLGEAARRFFAEPIDSDPRSLTRMEFLLAGYRGRLEATDWPWRSARVQAWFDAVVCRARPDLARFSSRRRQGSAGPAAAAPRCTVIGMATSPTGLGLNLRMTVGALRRLPIHPVVRDLGLDFPVEPSLPPPGAIALARDVVILHVNADMAPQILAHPLGRGRAGTYRIGFFLWELEVLPESHRLALDLVDEIWVPSEYLARIYRAACDRPVLNMRKGISLPDIPARAPRGDGPFRFLCSFDFHSSVERKNPWAVVAAFQQAFPPGDDRVGLVMKTTEVVPGHWGDPHGQWQRLLDAASADPRIEIIVEAQEFTEFLGLIADCDCVVSSHRAEGFGYLPAFAMLLGRPAIVTDYSGTQEYCDETTAFPVRWTPRPMAPEEAIFAVPGAHWAEIDVAHLAERMAEVFADPAAAATRAAAGRALLEREFSHAALAGRYGARLRELGALPAEIRGIP